MIHDSGHAASETTATQEIAIGGPPKRDVTADVTCHIEVTSDSLAATDQPIAATLGDGHARPSKNTVTPAAPMNVAKLMGTLFDVTSRCNVLLHVTLDRADQLTGLGFSQHACREMLSVSSAPSTKTPKLLGTLSRVLSDERRLIEISQSQFG